MFGLGRTLQGILNDAHPATSAVIEHLKKVGKQPVSLDQGLKACDAASKPPAQPR